MNESFLHSEGFLNDINPLDPKEDAQWCVKCRMHSPFITEPPPLDGAPDLLRCIRCQTVMIDIKRIQLVKKYLLGVFTVVCPGLAWKYFDNPSTVALSILVVFTLFIGTVCGVFFLRAYKFNRWRIQQRNKSPEQLNNELAAVGFDIVPSADPDYIRWLQQFLPEEEVNHRIAKLQSSKSDA